MVIRRDSLRAQTDFFSPMTGNTGTQIRYADAPVRKQETYGSKVKERLSDIGKGTRRAAPIMKAIKVAVQKTEDPFTQIAEKKSYAPQEENDLMGALEGAAGAAQDVVSEGVSKVQDVVRSTGRKAAERRAEQQYKRQQERAADLKAAETARQNIRTDFQNRVKGVSDEVKTQGDRFKSFSIAQIKRDIDQDIAQRKAAQDAKAYEQNRLKQRQLTQARLKGIESDVSGVRSEVKAYEKNRLKQRQITQARLKGVESKQETTAKETKDYRDRREQMRLQRQEAVDRRFGEQDKKLGEQDKRLGDQEKKVGEVKTNLATTYSGMIGVRESLAAIKAKREAPKKEAPKTVTIGGQTVAAKQSVASLPSNYKSTEAAAFAKAKAFQEAKKVAQRNPNVSISKTTGKAEATNNSARARAQAAAVNRKMSGKSISQTKAANQASMRAKAAERHASFKKAKAAGTHARTASAQRARNRAAAKARAKAAAKRRKSKKSCPDPSMLILMANGSQKKAGDLMVGDLIKTNHEKDMKLGEYKVEYVNVVNDIPKTKLTFDESVIVCSLTHKFYVGDDWKAAEDMVIGDEVSGQKLISIDDVEDGDVVHITVEDAHTYICEGLLSHNKRCDIRTKENITELTNMNLLRDDLADVAYFVRGLREVDV